MFKDLNIRPGQIKVFCMTFISMFLIVALQHLGLRLNIVNDIKEQLKFVSPLPQEESKLHNLLPLLEEKKSEFKIKEEVEPIIPQAYAASPLYADNASSFLVIDMDTGDIIAEKNGKQQMAIASITKVMTAVVALDLADPKEQFRIEENDTKPIPTNIGISAGEKLTLLELLQGSLLVSGNDAAEAIKSGIDRKYNGEIFIKAMNAKAKFLGLNDTNFTNPQGFDYGDNRSSARDLAILTQYALTKYPVINDIVKESYIYLPSNENHKEFKLHNWNGLIDVYPETFGVKIGYTYDAGKTTAVVSNRNSKKILVILLGAPGILERDLWAAQLLDLGYAKTLNLPPINVTEDQLNFKYSSWYY